MICKCKRCNYEWESRKGTEKPRCCPNCKQSRWETESKYKSKDKEAGK